MTADTAGPGPADHSRARHEHEHGHDERAAHGARPEGEPMTDDTDPTDPAGPYPPDDAPPDPAAQAWMLRARAAGHPVLGVRPGRFRPLPVAVRMTGVTLINDLLEIERETAKARVAWAHAIVPTAADLLALGEAVRTPVTVTVRPGRRRAIRTATATPPVGPAAVSDTRDGVTVHALELPAAWLSRPVTVRRRPPRYGTGGTVVPGCDAA